MDAALDLELGSRVMTFLSYPSYGRVPTAEFAAAEVCWTLLMMMELGGLDIPAEEREFLARPLEVWAELMIQEGKMPDGS